jgi:hypothetical protein
MAGPLVTPDPRLAFGLCLLTVRRKRPLCCGRTRVYSAYTALSTGAHADRRCIGKLFPGPGRIRISGGIMPFDGEIEWLEETSWLRLERSDTVAE